MNKRALISWLVVALLAVFAASCGGDEDDSNAANDGAASGQEVNGEGTSIATSSLSKDQFLQQANAICARETQGALVDLQAYFKKESPDGDVPREGVLLGRGLQAVLPASFFAQIEQIRELGAPEGDESEVEAFLQALEDAAKRVKKDPPTNDLELNRIFKQVETRGYAYGLDECAYG